MTDKNSDGAAVYTPRFVDSPLHRRDAVHRAVDWISEEFPSAKPAMNYRMVRCDGTLSSDFVVLMENDPSVVEYWEKPASFRWKDDKGKRRNYTPDFAVVLADGRWIAVEVMPMTLVGRTRFLSKAPFIRTAALDAGYDGFELWTDREISVQPKLAKRLAARRRAHLRRRRGGAPQHARGRSRTGRPRLRARPEAALRTRRPGVSRRGAPRRLRRAPHGPRRRPARRPRLRRDSPALKPLHARPRRTRQ